MPKLGSLKYQITQRLQSLDRTGESKHHAKERFKNACKEAGIKANPAQAEGIYSHNTINNYRQTGFEFICYIKEHYTEIRDINSITKEHVIEYLKTRDAAELSPYTVSKDMSALNKLFNLNITKEEAGGLRERSYKETTRSRVFSPEDLKYNPANYREQISLAKAFGVRRESIIGGQFQLKDVSLFKKDGDLYASVIEKGGLYREAPCLKSLQPEIEKMFPNIQERQSLKKTEFKEIYRDRGEKLFDKYTKKIDNHAFRGEYARNYYKELCEEKLASEKDIQHDYRGYDKELIQKVSEALGHSRLSVVVEHYMR